jgi:cytochrome P450
VSPTTDNNSATEVYYDPYDFEIDADPYPIWKRMRDEQPLFYNEKYDFYAISRFDDVEAGLKDWSRLISSKGTILELIKMNADLPIGMVIFEDPPSHECYRGLLSRVFTPKKMNAIEPQVRKYCADSLDPLMGSDRFDFVTDLGAKMPMRVIGMLLGIPEEDQQSLRDGIDEGLRLEAGEMPDVTDLAAASGAAAEGNFGEYLDWRAKNPSNDLMTELIQAEFEDHTGVRRRLTRDEVLGYVRLLSSAGNETTTKLISWTGKVLSDHPDQRREVAANRALVPQTIEEVLRFEAPSPIQARYVAEDVVYHGRTVPKGSAILLINGSGNRDERKFPNGEQFDIHRKIDHHLSFGYGIHFCLGAALARLEARVALDEVLQRFPDWTVDMDGAVSARTSTVRGWDKLPVVVG